MTTKLAEWASEHGRITKIGLPDGCGGNVFLLAVGSKYDFREPGAYLGNVGNNPPINQGGAP